MAQWRRLYAYLNIENPHVAWEVAIGRIQSHGLFTDQSFGISVWHASRLKKLSTFGLVDSVLDEFSLELYRKTNYPDKVSRMQGVYFFESEEMLNIAFQRWSIPINKAYISEVNFHGVNFSNHDSEWITDCMGGNDKDWFGPYLRGDTRGANPLTEVVASGIGNILNNDLRNLAIQKVLERTPDSSPFLFLAIAATKLGVMDAALSTPYVYLEDGRIAVHHATKLDTLQACEGPATRELIRLYEKGLLTYPIIRPNGPDAVARMPDLRDLKFYVDVPDAISVFQSVHASILNV